MDYEKKYKEALERARHALDCDRNGLVKTDKPLIFSMFSELKESEDERIRKEIIEHLRLEIEPECTLSEDEGKRWIAWLEKQGEPNPYSGTSFKYNGHTWGMCARDNGVEILIDGQLKGRVFTEDTNAKDMFIKALERVEEENSRGNKLTDCDKNSWWEDFKAYTSCIIKQSPFWNEKFIADVFEKVGLAKIVREQGNDELTSAVQMAMIELEKQCGLNSYSGVTKE